MTPKQIETKLRACAMKYPEPPQSKACGLISAT